MGFSRLASRIREVQQGPSIGFFVARAFSGALPKLALAESLLLLIVSVTMAVALRAANGVTAPYELIVPGLGNILRLSLALPLGFHFLLAIQKDEKEGLVSLCGRVGVPLSAFVWRRALGAAVVVALLMAVPMCLLSLIEASFGGGAEGVLARASLVLPSLLDSAFTALMLGAAPVFLGRVFASRLLVFGLFVGLAGLSALVSLRGSLGANTLSNVLSPLRALSDVESFLFGRTSWPQGLSAALSVVFFSAAVFLLGRAPRTLEQQRGKPARETGGA